MRRAPAVDRPGESDVRRRSRSPHGGLRESSPDYPTRRDRLARRAAHRASGRGRLACFRRPSMREWPAAWGPGNLSLRRQWCQLTAEPGRTGLPARAAHLNWVRRRVGPLSAERSRSPAGRHRRACRPKRQTTSCSIWCCSGRTPTRRSAIFQPVKTGEIIHFSVGKVSGVQQPPGPWCWAADRSGSS